MGVSALVESGSCERLTSAVQWSRLLPALFSARYLPHRFCYLAEPGLIWTNVVTDSLIAVAYGVLCTSLFLIAYKVRKVPGVRSYLWIIVSFGLFIATCGGTHAMEVVTVWWPFYPLAAAVKVLCAAVSVPTAILFAFRTRHLIDQVPAIFNLVSKTEGERDQAWMALEVSERMGAELSKTEVELKAANDLLNHVLDSTVESVMKIGINWKIVYVNRNSRELSPHLKVGAAFWDVFPPDVSPLAAIELKKAMDEGIRTSYETYYRPSDEWFLVNVYPSLGGICLFATTMTAHKQLEHALETQRFQALAQMNAVLDSTSDGGTERGSQLEGVVRQSEGW